MKKLIALMTILTLLTACTSKQVEPKKRVVTEFKIQKLDIPKELLTPIAAPDPKLLKGVKVCKGADRLAKYGKALTLANYKNTQKLIAIGKLVDE